MRIRPLLPLPALSAALLLAGCAGRPTPPVVAVAPPPPVALAPALPAGASPGMLVPQRLADGSFPTPNQALSRAGTLWHLRVGLNVAALSCGREQGAAIRAGYNAWLTAAKRPLAATLASYAAEYHVATPVGRDAYDDAMTRLYNFFAQTPVRPDFCAAAATIVAQLTASDPTALPAIATLWLSELDSPFIAFYRDYDAWRRAAAPRVAVAVDGAITRDGGGLVLDPAKLPLDQTVTAAR